MHCISYLWERLFHWCVHGLHHCVMRIVNRLKDLDALTRRILLDSGKQVKPSLTRAVNACLPSKDLRLPRYLLAVRSAVRTIAFYQVSQLGMTTLTTRNMRPLILTRWSGHGPKLLRLHRRIQRKAGGGGGKNTNRPGIICWPWKNCYT